MPISSKAPSSGTPANTQPQTTTAPKPPQKTVPVLGSRAAIEPVAKKVVAESPPFPAIDRNLVLRLFENIPEYKQHKIVNIDLLIQGMIYLATAPLKGVGPGGLSVMSSPMNNFLAQLIMQAVEKGSNAVQKAG